MMQRIEYCRHRAELADGRAERGSAAFRKEMAELADEWRDLAQHIETMDELSEAPAYRGSTPTD